MSSKFGKTATAFVLAFSLCSAPTMAAAATSALPKPVNPLATIAVFYSPAAATTLCGNSGAVAAAGAAAAQAPGAGCVLPVVDPAPVPPPPQAAAPLPPAPPPAAGIGLLPILLGIGGIAALALLISSGDDDDDDDDDTPPVTPS